MKKIIIVLAVFACVGVCVFGIGALSNSSVGLPRAIEADSPCPATGCASGQCHGFDDVPDPDGVHEMDCPKASCSSVECHAWNSFTTRYQQPSDASLNVWLLMPVVVIAGAVMLVKKVG